MQPPLLLIADYAYADPAGKLHVVGGGVDSFSFLAFPARLPRLSIAVKVNFDTDDPQPDHAVHVVLQDSASLAIASGPRLQVHVTPSGSNRLLFVWHLEEATIPSPGSYQVVLYLDDRSIATTGLEVSALAESRPAERYDRTPALLNQAYRAVQAREYEQARSLLGEAVEETPESLDSVIGLGFVLLLVRKPSEALSRFESAQARGYARPEILYTDIGVAHYLQSQYKEAIDAFRTALNAPVIRANALLAQINDQNLVAVEVKTVPAVLALVAANAAWASWRLNDLGTARDLHRLGTEAGKQAPLEPETLLSLSALNQFLGGSEGRSNAS